MIRFLLLAGIEWTDRHPVLMIGGAIVCVLAAGLFLPVPK